jgi:hypothetical protein
MPIMIAAGHNTSRINNQVPTVVLHHLAPINLPLPILHPGVKGVNRNVNVNGIADTADPPVVRTPSDFHGSITICISIAFISLFCFLQELKLPSPSAPCLHGSHPEFLRVVHCLLRDRRVASLHSSSIAPDIVRPNICLLERSLLDPGFDDTHKR